jgi:hypothetical protein
MTKGDWLIYYSSRALLESGELLQAFTAIGRMVDDEIYQVEMAPGFVPWRRNVTFLEATEKPIRPLLERPSFTTGRANGGYQFRRGHFEISESDFKVIAEAMGLSSGQLV